VHRPDTVLELAAQLHQPHRLPAVWSVIIPFYNERRHLRRCITSLAAQTVAHRLILVDNASTDGSAEAALEAGDALGLHPVVVREPRPGKVAALQAGLREVTSKYVATCDADTVYPAAYLATGERLLRKPGTAAAIAATTPPESSVLRTAAAGLRMSATAALLKQQCLNGGAGQVFRTSLLNLVGGFDPLIWNLVLEDHEIIARLESVGRIAYHARFHCHPLDRENGRHTMRWRFGERVRYHLTRSADRAAFFHDFLSPRLTERGLFSDKLRRHAEQLAES
jgi:glycosyltransferase involved in cell wall biosynthesis